MRKLLAVFLMLVMASPVFAQAERYELGQRLKRFEAAWEKHTDADARKRAAALLPDITMMFFSLRFGDAGRILDEAAWTLANKEPRSKSEQWAEALYAMPEKLLFSTEKEFVVTVKPFYAVKIERPANVTATLQFNRDNRIVVPLEKFPARVTIPLQTAKQILNGDMQLVFTVTVNEKVTFSSTHKFAVATDLTTNLDRFREHVKQSPPSLETATLQDRIELLTELSDGTIPETQLPGLALFKEGKVLIELEQYFLPTRVGQFWMSVPLEKKKTQPIRLFVPKGLDPKKPVPIVVALHGAGGSENLFFEGYGAGHIVKECEKRGWLLVAPRSGLNFGSGPPVKTIVEKLAERYPLDDKYIFLVGHSMGAAQTVALCQEHPGYFKAAAALGGGGGRVKQAAFAKLPFFIGVGDKDFALSGARALSKALPDAKLKEYPGIEHMLIVREALPDVFAMWDSLLVKK